MSRLAPTLQAFFTTRLASQLAARPHTVAAYRDIWRLLATSRPPPGTAAGHRLLRTARGLRTWSVSSSPT